MKHLISVFITVFINIHTGSDLEYVHVQTFVRNFQLKPEQKVVKEKTNVKKKNKTKNNLNTKTIANKGENVNIYFY